VKNTVIALVQAGGDAGRHVHSIRRVTGDAVRAARGQPGGIDEGHRVVAGVVVGIGRTAPHGCPAAPRPVPADTPQGSESSSELPAQSRCRYCPGSVGADRHQGVAVALVADLGDAHCPGPVRRGVPLDGNPADGHRQAEGVARHRRRRPVDADPRQPPSRVPDEAPGPRRRPRGQPPAGPIGGEHHFRLADASRCSRRPRASWWDESKKRFHDAGRKILFVIGKGSRRLDDLVAACDS
jgi:hypothetical protein